MDVRRGYLTKHKGEDRSDEDVDLENEDVDLEKNDKDELDR